MNSDDGQPWVREVWASNLEQEMAVLRDLVERYPYLSMVSETFPSFIRPTRPSAIYHTKPLGYWIPRCSCSSNRKLPHISRLPLSNAKMQRGPSKNHSIGNQFCGWAGEYAGSLYMAIQLQIQPKVRVNRDANSRRAHNSNQITLAHQWWHVRSGLDRSSDKIGALISKSMKNLE